MSFTFCGSNTKLRPKSQPRNEETENRKKLREERKRRAPGTCTELRGPMSSSSTFLRRTSTAGVDIFCGGWHSISLSPVNKSPVNKAPVNHGYDFHIPSQVPWVGSPLNCGCPSGWPPLGVSTWSETHLRFPLSGDSC